MVNAPLISLTGLISGFQEAFYKFEVSQSWCTESGVWGKALYGGLTMHMHRHACMGLNQRCMLPAHEHAWDAQPVKTHCTWHLSIYESITVQHLALLRSAACTQRMPPGASRQTWKQAMSLYGIIGKRTMFAGIVGAVFCYADAALENARGKSMTNGMAAGALAGLAFGGFRPMPQPIAWPIMFALTAASADIVADVIPANLAGHKMYGTIPGRENWGDPEPPRPPIMDTSAAVRPAHGAHFWRGN